MKLRHYLDIAAKRLLRRGPSLSALDLPLRFSSGIIKERSEAADMEMPEIIEIAKKKGIDPSTRRKAELILAIQKTEGHAECFATKKIYHCEEFDCLWRGDCVKSLSI